MHNSGKSSTALMHKIIIRFLYRMHSSWNTGGSLRFCFCQFFCGRRGGSEAVWKSRVFPIFMFNCIFINKLLKTSPSPDHVHLWSCPKLLYINLQISLSFSHWDPFSDVQTSIREMERNFQRMEHDMDRLWNRVGFQRFLPSFAKKIPIQMAGRCWII